MVVLLGCLDLDPDEASAVTMLTPIVSYWRIVRVGALLNLALGRQARIDRALTDCSGG